MRTPIYRQNTKPSLFYLMIASLIGVAIGYFLFSTFEQNREVKGVICLVIDDFGFAQNNNVQDFFHLMVLP